MICMKKLRFSSRPRAKVRHQGPPGSARAQPCISREFIQAWLLFGYHNVNKHCLVSEKTFWKSSISMFYLTFPCMMRNSSDRSSLSPQGSFTTFSTAILDQTDWSEREPSIKMTVQCCWCFFVCRYYSTTFLFHMSQFTYQCNIIIARWRNFVKIHYFCLFPLLFLPQLALFLIYPGCPLTHLKEKVCWKPEFNSGFKAHMVYFRSSHTLIFYQKVPGN